MEIINKRGGPQFQQKGGDQLQQVDGKSKRLSWFCLMGLLICLKVVHILFKCIILHEQGPMHGAIALMEVG
jgi:hypothetical protein